MSSALRRDLATPSSHSALTTSSRGTWTPTKCWPGSPGRPRSPDGSFVSPVAGRAAAVEAGDDRSRDGGNGGIEPRLDHDGEAKNGADGASQGEASASLPDRRRLLFRSGRTRRGRDGPRLGRQVGGQHRGPPRPSGAGTGASPGRGGDH